MAKLRFEINGQPNDVEFASYLIATNSLSLLLRELDAAISGRSRGTLAWYVSALHSNNGLAIDLLSRLKPPTRRQKEPTPDQSSRVAGSLVVGLDNLERLGVSPPYLSETGLVRLQDMFNLLNRNGAQGYKATDLDGGRAAEVSTKAADAIRGLLPVSRPFLGSVEGRLEAISIHNRRQFVVYHARTKKGVTCRFEDPMLPTVVAILGKRVVASGVMQSNVKGEPVRLKLDSVRVLGEGKLPTTSELTGSHPDFTNGATTEDHMRYLRRD